jgi:hypothetical protein
MRHDHHNTDRPVRSGGYGARTRLWARSVLTVLLLGCCAFPTWAEDTRPPAPDAQDMETGVRTAPGTTLLGAVRRRPLTAGIAEYSFRVRVGSGTHDIIGLHRVVKEIKPFFPIQTSQAVFMAHGDVWGFDGAFLASLASTTVPHTQALPIFLAQHDIDVWGIDFRWTLVPLATTDFHFMQRWDLGTDVEDLRLALLTARQTRFATGSGFDQLHLLGWSRGGMTGYLYLNAEAQSPTQHVKGFIPVDIFLKTDDDDLRRKACERFDSQQDRLDAGTFHDTTGMLFAQVGTLAITNPTGNSTIVPGLTNFQAALFLGTTTFALFDPVPFYHFVAGPAGASVPATLLYTQEAYWFDFLLGTAPYEPVNIFAQGEQLLCDVSDPHFFDDHLADITVPILYVGAGGGFGEFGIYTTTLLGSQDITIHLVDLRPDVPDTLRIEDFGHADLFLADDAAALVWQPILFWLQGH